MFMTGLRIPMALLMVAALVAVPRFVSAQEKPQAEVEAILKRAVEAAGGEEVVKKHRSTLSKGKFVIAGQGLEGSLEIRAAAPNRFLLLIDLPGVGRVENGFDGKIGWASDPINGPRLIQGKELEELKVQADYDSDLFKLDDYKEIKNQGVVDFEGEKCHKLEMTRKETGKTETRFFSVASGLLTGVITKSETPMGELDITVVVGNYKEFEGQKIATNVDTRIGPITQTFIIETVEFNVLKDSDFEVPSQIKALIRD